MALATERQVHNKVMQGLSGMQTALINVEVMRLEIAETALAEGDIATAVRCLKTSLDHMRGWTS